MKACKKWTDFLHLLFTRDDYEKGTEEWIWTLRSPFRGPSSLSFKAWRHLQAIENIQIRLQTYCLCLFSPWKLGIDLNSKWIELWTSKSLLTVNDNFWPTLSLDFGAKIQGNLGENQEMKGNEVQLLIRWYSFNYLSKGSVKSLMNILQLSEISILRPFKVFYLVCVWQVTLSFQWLPSSAKMQFYCRIIKHLVTWFFFGRYWRSLWKMANWQFTT